MLYMCDFGNVAQISDPSTYGHRRCGTVSYMAPELFVSTRCLNGEDFYKADIWSAGILVYAMFTGMVLGSRWGLLRGMSLPEVGCSAESDRCRLKKQAEEARIKLDS